MQGYSYNENQKVWSVCLIRILTNSLHSLYMRPRMVPLGNLLGIGNGLSFRLDIETKRKKGR